MQRTAQLAGFVAAHAIWSVADGEVLIPMVVTESPEGKRTLERFVAETTEESVVKAREHLSNASASRVALAFDGYITLADGKTDAVFIEARERRGDELLPFEIAVPYRNAQAPGGFAVYRPKLIKVPEGMLDVDAMVNAFFTGVDAHDEAAKVWNAHLDQSR